MKAARLRASGDRPAGRSPTWGKAVRCRRCLGAALGALVLVVALATAAAAHKGAFTALAVPAEDIQIDGSFGDWPATAPTYRIESVLKGYPNYDGDDPEPEDLTARFRAAWSPEAQRLFVAVEVRDDDIALGSTPSGTDALELYLDGTHGTEDPQQYLMFPGDGATYQIFGTSRNPTLNRGDIDAAEGLGAWAIHGDTIVYEWSLRAFESIPKDPVRLTARQRIGFDVVAVDKDGASNSATWLSWSPQGGKVSNADRLGDLYLLASPATLDDMVRVHGRVVHTGSDDGWRGMQVDVRDASDVAWGSAMTGPEGVFDLWSPGGSVTVTVPESGDEVALTLTAGDSTHVLIPVLHRQGSRLPLWPFAITLGLFGTVALGAVFPMRKRLSLIGGAVAAPGATFEHLARFPEWTAPAALALLSAALGSVAGVNQYPGQLWGALVGMPGALSTILLLAVPLMMFLAFVVLQIAVWIGWALLLWLGAQLAGGRGRFFHMVSAAGYAGVPAALGLCVASLGIAFGDPNAVGPVTGLGALQLATGPLAQVLMQIEVFTLWSWGLAAVAVACVMGLPARRATTVTALCWAATLALVYGFHAVMQAVAEGLSGGI
jgi:hypothetical protein